MVYDLIIIGAGVAGMAASIYASRYKINHLIFGEIPGGQGTLAHAVENYPGYVSTTGQELMAKFSDHVKNYGVEIKTEKVTDLRQEGEVFLVTTSKEQYRARALILAMGARSRALNIPGEEKFLGRGVSYCSTCDAPLFKDKVVAVVGGGDSAVAGAVHLASFANKVYIIHRRNEFRAEGVWVEKMRASGKVEEILENQVVKVEGVEKAAPAGGQVEQIVLEKPHKGNQNLKVDGLFIEIGQVPASALVNNLGVELDPQGFIQVSPDMETNVSGVFAGGDLAVVKGGIPFRQFITAAADGARAAASAYRFLHQKAPAPDWS